MSKMIEVKIDSVRVSLTNQQRIVILKVVGQERYLPIWIGLYEAEAITISLQKIQVARPQTHDLIRILIQSLNAELTHVEVTSLSEDVFYGNLFFRIEGQEKKIDCRPSDALALAIRLNVPILVAEEVMDQAGIVPEEDLSGFDPIEAEEALLIENGENLEVFEDFLQNINLDDLQSNSDEDKPDEE